MNQEAMQALYDQAMKLWIHPDILARNKKGQVTLPVVIRAAQIIFGMDGSYTVRLNSEVRGKIVGTYKKQVKVGDNITYNDIEDLHLAERDPEDINFGHLTIISQGDNKWNISFSFEYGAEQVRQYLHIGKEYLDAAKKALPTSQRAALALAMTAGENLLKARLATSPIVELKTKKHSSLIGLLGKFSQHENNKKINPEYNAALKFLHKHFDGVRYEPNYPKIHKSTVKKNINVLGRLYIETSDIVRGIDIHSFNQRRIKISDR